MEEFALDESDIMPDTEENVCINKGYEMLSQDILSGRVPSECSWQNAKRQSLSAWSNYWCKIPPSEHLYNLRIELKRHQNDELRLFAVCSQWFQKWWDYVNVEFDEFIFKNTRKIHESLVNSEDCDCGIQFCQKCSPFKDKEDSKKSIVKLGTKGDTNDSLSNCSSIFNDFDNEDWEDSKIYCLKIFL